MQNLVRISKMESLPFKLPFKPATFYKWFHLGKYPEIFVKLAGGLFVDLDRTEKLIDASRARRKGCRLESQESG